MESLENMNLVSAGKSSAISGGCSDLVTMAEQELSAFFRAVRELFGREQARLAAEDWLHELMQAGGLPASIREWRWITARASTRLADRVNVSSVLR